MKNTKWITPLIILVIILVVYGIYWKEFKKDVVPAGEMLIKKSVWDSIKNIALMEPIVIRDTIKIAGKTIIKTTTPTTMDKDSIKVYVDSLSTPDINVKVTDIVQGTILNREWRYVPIITKFREIRYEYIPKIVENTVLMPVSKAGIYIYGQSGGNASAFVFGAGIDYINKKDRILGYTYQRLGDKNFHSIKLGVKIKLKK